LFPKFRPETGASHGHQNVGALHFYPQVRVGHVFLPRRRTPTLRMPAYCESLSSIASFAWPSKSFPLGPEISFRALIHAGTLPPSARAGNFRVWHFADAYAGGEHVRF